MHDSSVRAIVLAGTIALGLVTGTAFRSGEAVASECENDECKSGHCNNPADGKTCDMTVWGCEPGPDCPPD